MIEGYRKKPLSISLISAAFLLIPLMVLVQAFILADGSWRVLGAVLASSFFVQELYLSWSAALAVFIVTRLSFICFILLTGYVLAAKFVNLVFRPDLEAPLGFWATVFWFGVALYFFGSSLKAPYLNPKLRWWTRPPRVKLCQGAVIINQGFEIPVEVVNLSRGGAFVKLDAGFAQGQLRPQKLGEEFELRMSLGQGGEPQEVTEGFSVTARLVWKGKPDTPYRDGMGVQFISLSGEHKRQLNRNLRRAR